MVTLQHVMNSLEYPSFICDENKVILVNSHFENKKLEKSCCEDYWKKRNFLLQKTQINKNLYLCQLIPDEVKMLKNCTQQLTKAMALL